MHNKRPPDPISLCSGSWCVCVCVWVCLRAHCMHLRAVRWVLRPYRWDTKCASRDLTETLNAQMKDWRWLIHVLCGSKSGTRHAHSERRDACWVADDVKRQGAWLKRAAALSLTPPCRCRHCLPAAPGRLVTSWNPDSYYTRHPVWSLHYTDIS